MSSDLTDWAAETMRRTCVEQGLSPTLTDPGQLERLAVLFDTAAVEPASARQAADDRRAS